jgi:hypothetical protein
MFRTVCTFVAAALLFGCAATRDGLDYSSVSKTYGGLKNGQGRIVLLRESAFVGSMDGGYPISLDGQSIGDLRTGTFLVRDVTAGRHELSTSQWAFPGTTKLEIGITPGRTYFYAASMSERGKALMVGSMAGLAVFAVTAVATSDKSNPGPVDFVLLDEAAGQQMVSQLQLAQ